MYRVQRRASRFKLLHDALLAPPLQLRPPPFPITMYRPRWSHTDGFKQARLVKLQAYLRQVVAAAPELDAIPVLAEFLGVPGS